MLQELQGGIQHMYTLCMGFLAYTPISFPIFVVNSSGSQLFTVGHVDFFVLCMHAIQFLDIYVIYMCHINILYNADL